MMRVLEDVFRSMLKKRYGSDENFDIIINVELGDLEIYRNRLIVDEDEVEDENLEISISDAQNIDPDFEIGEEAIEEVKMEDFGRRAILAARQTLLSRILELEKDEIYRKYKDRVGEIVTGEVYQIWKRELMILDDEGNELILPKGEMIPRDFYKKGDSIRAVVLRVEMQNNSPRIILSRTSPVFLERLFELEVPEILDGLITIKNVVREPGERAKVAVESYDDRIDPVGACVGMKGSRIHGGHNIKLASKLAQYEIDVYRENVHDDGSDIDLDEFSDEIDEWILDELKSIGLDTARSVLDVANDELVRRTELEEETVVEIKKILASEFD
jgi:N utilization substance protein A